MVFIFTNRRVFDRRFSRKDVKMGKFNPIPERQFTRVAGVPALQPLFESAVLGQASHRTKVVRLV